jgi:hypothetical protein
VSAQPHGGTMTEVAQATETWTLRLTAEVHVRSSPSVTFAALLE